MSLQRRLSPFWIGVLSAFDMSGRVALDHLNRELPAVTERPGRRGFAADREAIAGDWATVVRR